MLKNTTIAALIFSAASAFTQNNFVDGYMIKTEGDTVKVSIKLNEKKPVELFEKVYIKVTEADKKTYKPGKIMGFGFNGEDYISKKVDGTDVFLKRIAAGTINLYEHQVEVVQMNKEKIVSDFYAEKYSGTELIPIKSSKFKKQVTDLVKDNEDLLKDIEDKKYEFENLKELVEEYNNWSKDNKG